jgi:type II secretory pathway component PulM
MTDAVSAPIRKFAALGLAVALAWSAFSFVLEPLARRIADNQDRIEEQRLLLGRLSGLAETASAAGMQEAGGVSAQQRRLLLEGDSEAVQLSNLQAILKDAVTAEGVRIQSLRTLPQQQYGEFSLAGALVSFNASMPAAQRILHQLETIDPVLILESLDMAPLSVSAARAAGEEEQLRIEIRVLAAALQRTGGPAR